MDKKIIIQWLRYTTRLLACFFFIISIHYPIPMSREDIPVDIRYFGLSQEQPSRIVPSPSKKEQSITKKSKLDRYLEDIQHEKVILTRIAGKTTVYGEPDSECIRLYSQIIHKLKKYVNKKSITDIGADIIANDAKNALKRNDKQLLLNTLTSIGNPEFEKHAILNIFSYRPYVVIDSHKNNIIQGIIVSADFSTVMMFVSDDKYLPAQVTSQVRKKDLSSSRLFKVVYFLLLIVIFILQRWNDHIAQHLETHHASTLKTNDPLLESQQSMTTRLQALRLRKQLKSLTQDIYDQSSKVTNENTYRKIPEKTHIIITVLVLLVIILNIVWSRYLTPPYTHFDDNTQKFIEYNLNYDNLNRINKLSSSINK